MPQKYLPIGQICHVQIKLFYPIQMWINFSINVFDNNYSFRISNHQISTRWLGSFKVVNNSGLLFV